VFLRIVATRYFQAELKTTFREHNVLSNRLRQLLNCVIRKMNIPLGIVINIPAVTGRRTFSSERAAAILSLLETAYRVQIDLVSALQNARRRVERTVLTDILLRITDPHICQVIYDYGFTDSTRQDIIINVNEMRAIASINIRSPFDSTVRNAIRDMIRGYEDMADLIA
jgi:RNAse (barnase) inhibitor barstar